jgi:tRNA (uracil-5-)-methyltransferase
MTCNYFGICGSCTLGGNSYEEQLQIKKEIEKERFNPVYKGVFDIIKSEESAFRNRAEFRIWKDFEEDTKTTPTIHYAMNNMEKKPFPIKSCSIVSPTIAKLMPELLQVLQADEILRFKLFSIEFLSAFTGDILITLIYHKKLDETWSEKAKQLETKFGIKIIGRSKKQKLLLSDEFIQDTLSINNKKYTFKYFEGGFTQPNQKVNEKMIEWVIQNISCKNDLCELYCGGGNFTIPLSDYFDKVLATEISKTSIKSAKQNCELNHINNIKFIRMSSEEFVEAKEGKREFRRLQEADVDLKDYNFSTIFVDPPRAGLDETTTKLASKFDQIIYISCNPVTLLRDLEKLSSSHTIQKFAFFDQFAYSNHIESGVILKVIR